MKTFKDYMLEEGKLGKTISSALVGLALVGLSPLKTQAGEVVDGGKLSHSQMKRRENSFIKALIAVESNGKDKAIGDNGKAFGPLQIWQIYVDDVNRIYKTNYKHEDMFDRDKAIDATLKYLAHYGKAYQKKTGKQPTTEVFARIHNGGPNGWKNPKTDKYWDKVKKWLK